MFQHFEVYEIYAWISSHLNLKAVCKIGKASLIIILAVGKEVFISFLGRTSRRIAVKD